MIITMLYFRFFKGPFELSEGEARKWTNFFIFEFIMTIPILLWIFETLRLIGK